MADIVFHVAVGVKNDGVTRDAGRGIADILQALIEDAVLDMPWVTDMLVSVEQGGGEAG
jgi:hypothetical protein